MAASGKVVDVSRILANIVGFLPGDPLNLGLIGSNNDVWHWFKHTFTFLGDIPHTLTLNEYVRLGKELGQRAARGESGTYTKVRYKLNSAGGFDARSVGQFDILVYWERQVLKRDSSWWFGPTA